MASDLDPVLPPGAPGRPCSSRQQRIAYPPLYERRGRRRAPVEHGDVAEQREMNSRLGVASPVSAACPAARWFQRAPPDVFRFGVVTS
jgi:hypothetical protein